MWGFPADFLTLQVICLFFRFAPLPVAGDPLQLGPIQKHMTLLDYSVYLCRIFRDAFQSRYGRLVFLAGIDRHTMAG